MTDQVVLGGTEPRTVTLVATVEIDPQTNQPVPSAGASVGAPADAAATSDTGAFSLIALTKRALQNWATLLARVPALVSGRVPVAVLLTPFGDDTPVDINDATAKQSTTFAAGTVAVRIHKSAGVGVRVRVVNSGGPAITTTTGRVLLPDFVGPVDVPATEGQVLQVIRMAGDTGTGLVVASTLRA